MPHPEVRKGRIVVWWCVLSDFLNAPRSYVRRDRRSVLRVATRIRGDTARCGIWSPRDGIDTVEPVALAEIELDGVTDLVSHVLDGGRGRSWFRGQGCDHWGLKSSLSRRLGTAGASQVLATETRLLTRFRQRSLPLWPEGYPQSNWEHLFAMQHYGVPTRLLDWSESLLVAAFFAGDHDQANNGCIIGACRPTVWVLDPRKLNAENPRLQGTGADVLTTTDLQAEHWAPGVSETQFGPWPIAMYGTHNSARIVAQQGTFTVDGKEQAPLEASAAVSGHDDVLEKIVLNVSHHDLVEQLRYLGVRRGTVYPDLPSLAADITSEEVD